VPSCLWEARMDGWPPRFPIRWMDGSPLCLAAQKEASIDSDHCGLRLAAQQASIDSDECS